MTAFTCPKRAGKDMVSTDFGRILDQISMFSKFKGDNKIFLNVSLYGTFPDSSGVWHS